MRPVPVFPDYSVQLVIPASCAISKPAIIDRCVSLLCCSCCRDFLSAQVSTYVVNPSVISNFELRNDITRFALSLVWSSGRAKGCCTLGCRFESVWWPSYV